MGCAKVNLLVGNPHEGVSEFYRGLGYDRDQTISRGKRLITEFGPE